MGGFGGVGMNAVYMLASRRHGTIYIGVTSDLHGRIHQHREDLTPGFTSRHNVKRLVWFERHDGIVAAIAREKAVSARVEDQPDRAGQPELG